MHVDELRKACPGIEQVWLMRHGAGRAGAGQAPEWELLAFADRPAFEKLRAESSLRRSDVRLLVVVDGDRFESPWGEAVSGTLSEIDWRLTDAESATYAESGTGEAGAAPRSTAVRVR